MDKQTQMAWVKHELKERGQVSRNEALRNYFSRLAARVADLRQDGWNIEGKKENGDYVYRLVK